MKRFGWLEATGLLVLGGAGAYAVTRYMGRPLSEKVKIGDTAFVPLHALHMTDAAQASAIDLGALAVASAVKVEVTGLARSATDPNLVGVAGKDFGLRVPVNFSKDAILRLERSGAQVA